MLTGRHEGAQSNPERDEVLEGAFRVEQSIADVNTLVHVFTETFFT